MNRLLDFTDMELISRHIWKLNLIQDIAVAFDLKGFFFFIPISLRTNSVVLVLYTGLKKKVIIFLTVV